MMKTLLGLAVLALLVGCETGPRQVLPYVMENPAGGQDLYLYDLEAGSSIPLKQTPLVEEADPAVDYAGRLVAYVARETAAGQGKFSIRVHDLETGQAKEVITSDQPLFDPIFSGDSEELAYVKLNEGKLQIFIHRLNSGQEDKSIGFGCEPSWRQDDRAIFYSDREDPEAPSGNLMVHELKRGINQSLTLRGNGFANLPRGTSVVYTTLAYSRRNEAVWMIDANSRQTRLSSPGKDSRDTDPVHINGSKFVAFTRTDVATNKSSIFVVERYAAEPVETLLFESKGNAYTQSR